MRNRPLILPLLALVVGALAANFAVPVGAWLLYSVAILFALLLCLLRYSPPLILAFLVSLLVAQALVQSRLSPPESVTQLLRQAGDRPVVLQGVVEQRPEAFHDGSRLLLRIDDGRGGWLLRVTVGEGVPTAITGDRVQISGRIRSPRSLELPGGFDGARFLARRGIHATTFVKNAAAVELRQGGVDYPLRRWFDCLAGQLSRDIDLSVPAPANGVLKAMLLGIRGGVPPELEASYAVTGVNHILSVSGFHVGVLAVSLVSLCTWLARRSQTLMLWVNVRRWSVLAVLPVIFAYLLLTGMAPATIRSVLMLAAVCVAVLDEREHDHLDTLTLAAVLLLLAAPWLLFDISCQLSFLALWGIIVFTPRIEQLLPVPAALGLRRIITLVAASLAAILVTAPLVAFYFHLFSLTGIVANLFVVPLMGYGAVVIGFAGLLLAPGLPPVAAWLFKVAGLLVQLANRGVEMLANAPAWRGVSPSVIELTLGLALILTAAVRSRWRWPLLIALFTCGLTVRLLASNSVQGALQATFLSVGQAEATLVRLPDGRTMLVDTGGSALQEDLQWGERILAPALWRLGVDRLDYLVLTHPHADHAGGAPYLLRAFPVGEVWLSGGVPEPQWREIVQDAAVRHIPCRRIDGRTSPLLVGGVRIEPFWPLPSGATDDPNDCSLVFRLGWGKFSILFAGDIGWEVADYLARTNGKRLASTVLKVPHHGSRHSDTPTLYRAVQPELALISVGYQNRFRLPSADTVSSLHAMGIPLLRTDLDGTINLRVDSGGQLPIIQRHFRHFN